MSAWETRARVRLALGNPREAVRDCTKCRALDKGYTRALLTRGLGRLEAGERAEAAKDFEEFIRRAPESALAEYARQKLEEARR